MLCDVVCLHRVVRENTLRDALWPYRFAYCLFFFSAGLLFGLDFVQDVSLVSTIYNDEYTCNNRDNKPNITLRRSTILYLLISFQINIQTRTLCWCPLNNIGNWTKKSEKKLRCDLSLSRNWIKKNPSSMQSTYAQATDQKISVNIGEFLSLVCLIRA